VTAENAPPPSLEGFNVGAGMGIDPPAPDPFDNRLLQKFTAMATGQPATASLVANRGASTTAALWVEIVTLNGNQVADVLATGSLPASNFTTGSLSAPLMFTEVPLAATAQVVAGLEYGVVFRSLTVDANYRVYGASGDRYAPGQTLRSQNSDTYQPMSSGSDLFFRVTVVPEPASMLGALWAGAAIEAARRRGGRRP
jgi:hypothetical protein